MLKFLLSLFIYAGCQPFLWADSIGHYMGVANNIPRMEMKTDANSQAWARSARNVLLLTCESIWEGLQAMNQIGLEKGNPLFSVQNPEQMTAERMADIIQETYTKMALNDEQKNKTTVAQVALIGVQERYACQAQAKPQEGPSVQLHQTKASLAHKMLLRASPY